MLTTRTRIARLSTACALTLTLGAVTVGPALASHDSWGGSAPPTATSAEDDAGSSRPALLDADTATVQGRRMASGACKYKSSLSLAPDQMAVGQETIGVDDATCTMKVRRGTPADAPTAPTSADGVGTTAIVGHSAGYFKSFTEDPVFIDVNAVRNDVNWFWDGSRVAQMTCDKSFGLFAPTGWVLVASNTFCRYENNQTQSHSSSFAQFRNVPFCWPNTTETVYDRNNVYGMANGWLRGDSSVVNRGGCTNLLSTYSELRRTL